MSTQKSNQASSTNDITSQSSINTNNGIEDTMTPRSLSSNVAEYGSSKNPSPTKSNLTADSNAFFELHDENIKLSPSERAKKLEEEMEHTNFDQRRTSQGNADKIVNIGKEKDIKIE